MSITIDELKAAKDTLEEAILFLVREFEHKTDSDVEVVLFENDKKIKTKAVVNIIL